MLQQIHSEFARELKKHLIIYDWIIKWWIFTLQAGACLQHVNCQQKFYLVCDWHVVVYVVLLDSACQALLGVLVTNTLGISPTLLAWARNYLDKYASIMTAIKLFDDLIS